MHRIIQGLVYMFRAIATTLCAKVHQPRIHGIEIGRQVGYLRDIGIALVTVSHQPHANLWRMLGLGHAAGNRPDLFLGGLNQATHTAGRIQYEYHVYP